MAEIDELKAKLKDAVDQEKIELLLQISGSYNAINEQDKALIYQKQALDLAQAIKDENYIAICYTHFVIDFLTSLKRFQKIFLCQFIMFCLKMK